MPLDLEAIKAREAATTPGPWRFTKDLPFVYGKKGCGCIFKAKEIFMDRGERLANAEFVAHSKKDVADLVVEVEALRYALVAVRNLAMCAGEAPKRDQIDLIDRVLSQ